MRNLLMVVLLFSCFGLMAQSEAMTNKKLGKIIKEQSEAIEGIEGNWQIYINERVLFIITDTRANRMRIFTPIIETTEIDENIMKAMLIANFHTALDAKYSIYEGLVISTFTHPLAELSEGQAIDAVQQVVRLAETFGSTFTSTEFIFGGGVGEEPIEETDEAPKRKIKKS